MRKYLIVFSLIISSLPLFSQNFGGKVFNESSRTVVYGANIKLDGPEKYLLFTDKKGEFLIKELKKGNYKLSISSVGFEEYSINFDLIEGQTLNLEIPLRESLLNLPEIEVISASRRNSNSEKLPFASNVLFSPSKSENIPRTSPEALNIIPGVFIQKTNHGGGSPFIRGLTGNQTLMLIDGIRMNNSTYRYGPNQYLNTIDPFSIEKIEVLKGSGSVQYGSDAIGGVIQVFTKNPDFSQRKNFISDINLRYASGNMEKTGSTEFSYSTPRVVFSGVIGLKNFGHLIGGDTTGVQSPSGYTESDASLKLRLKLFKDSEIIISNQFLLQKDVDVYHKVKLENFQVNKMGTQGRNLSYIKFKTETSSLWFKQINLTASSNESIEIRNSLKNASLNAGQEKDKISTSNLTGEILSDFSKKWRATSGIEYYLDKIKSVRQVINIQTGQLSNYRGLYPNDASYSNVSLFSLHHMNLGPFTIESGLRFNWLHASLVDRSLGQVKLSPKAFVWNAGINYTVGKQNIYFSLNSGYRAPNIDDLGTLGIVDFRYELPAYSLKPEKNLNTELGYKYANKTIGFGFSIFQNNLKDLITRVQTNQVIDTYKVYIKENNGKAVIKGVEGFLQWKFNQNFILDMFTSFNHGVNISRAEPLRRVPPLNGNIAFKYKLSNFYIKGELAWADKQSRLAQGDIEDNRIPINGTPGWNILNVYSGFSFRKIDLRASLQNIYNIDYRTHGSGINGVGRSVWLNIQYKLGGINN